MSKTQATLMVWWPKAHEHNKAEDEGRTLRVRYEVHAPGGKLHGGEEALTALPKDLPCLVLAAPSEVSLFSVVPPKLSGNKLKDALPFLVEPFLLNEPEENHVTLWGKLVAGEAGNQLSAVISKTHARSIVAGCRKAGLKLVGISCETLREPVGNAPVAWFSGDDFIWVDGLQVPLVVPVQQSAVLKVMLQNRISQTGVGKVFMNAGDAARLKELLGEIPAALPIETPGKAMVQGAAQLVSKTLVSAEELRRMGMKGMGPTKGSQGLMTACLGLLAVAVLGLNALAFKATQNAQTIEDTIAQRYAAVLPTTPMVADPLLLIQREKNTLTAGAGNTDQQGVANLLHAVGLAMDDAPFNSMVDFAWADNTLSVRFTPNLSTGTQESALQKLKSSGLAAKWLITGKDTGPVLQVQKKGPQ